MVAQEQAGGGLHGGPSSPPPPPVPPICHFLLSACIFRHLESFVIVASVTDHHVRR